MNNALVAYRKFLNLTQQQMAKIISSCLTSYNMKEQGKIDFTQSEMVAITNYIKQRISGVTMDDIFFKNEVINLRTNAI